MSPHSLPSPLTPPSRYADRLGMGLPFDFGQLNVADLRRKICYRLCMHSALPAL